MDVVALADFGSTFTKVTLVEDGSGRLLARAHHATTVFSDVMQGYDDALERATAQLDSKARLVAELAASSAGGGLCMAAAGLVDELTAAAGRQAALNAGAKVELVLAGDLQQSDCDRLHAIAPEILLFCGGTDGGQAIKVLHNARVLAKAPSVKFVVVACNTQIATEVASIFERPGRSIQVVNNVLPAIDRLEIESARSAIHELFIEHVIGGKGLSADPRFGRLVTMPTPEAVLEAVRLLGLDGERNEGAAEPGGVVVVDIGGATTDIHSAVPLTDRPAYITATGLPSLPVTRSVQGDLGLRWSADSVVTADRAHLLKLLSDEDVDNIALEAHAARRRHQPGFLAVDPVDQRVDDALAESCIALALRRHCGTLATVYLPGQGTQFVQRGLDLREVPVVIGTGGALVHRPDSELLLERAVTRRPDDALMPRRPTIVIDRSYLLASVGLLATRDPAAAGRLLNKLRKDIHANRACL